MLVVNQFGGSIEAPDERMGIYLSIFHKIARKFEVIYITCKPQNKIKHVDALAFLVTAWEFQATR